MPPHLGVIKLRHRPRHPAQIEAHAVLHCGHIQFLRHSVYMHYLGEVVNSHFRSFFCLKQSASKSGLRAKLGENPRLEKLFDILGWVAKHGLLATHNDWSLAADNSTTSLADLPWWGIFKDPALQDLIRLALTNNYDLRITLSRVDQARALEAQARSQFLPQVNYEDRNYW